MSGGARNGRKSSMPLVPETFFWREVEQIKALASVIVPEFIDRRLPGPFRIWDAQRARAR